MLDQGKGVDFVFVGLCNLLFEEGLLARVNLVQDDNRPFREFLVDELVGRLDDGAVPEVELVDGQEIDGALGGKNRRVKLGQLRIIVVNQLNSRFRRLLHGLDGIAELLAEFRFRFVHHLLELLGQEGILFFQAEVGLDVLHQLLEFIVVDELLAAAVFQLFQKEFVPELIDDEIKIGFEDDGGGEEFFFFLPEMNLDEASELLNEIKVAVSKLPIMYNDEAHHVTMTFGVEEYDYRSSLEELVKRADDKLYYGKNHGRNQVVF